ncbi:LOW QUALITY PROTEIN: uncharacterized protein LOC109836679 [Asparagus officinalis]|uniref:LOW QUALITY PROTEIN: uncharacterized protein LOC109836679 n=1 Tax=Asparagus officinalis TaxID=4686 RepID=UPI00098E7B92|nr:LOW QUALITY PROTEIN: uncharacterized protein LOC109836679 [Asparagus officinalis]
MSDSYRKVKAGRLTFKGGDLATVKSIDKKKNKKKKHKSKSNGETLDPDLGGDENHESATAAERENIYTIDAAKKMKYEELFPVETKKFGYDPANKEKTGARSVEEALDDRVKKKADRYCK